MMESSENRSMRAGVIGLGMIGGGIATSLARSGRAPVVFDVRAEHAASLEGSPQQARSPAELASMVDVVFVVVVTGEQVQEVIHGSEGILEGASPGLVIAIVSTVPV